MHTKSLIFLAFSLLATGSASAGLILTTNPANGIISGTRGSTVGWGFTFTASDANYYSLDSVEFCFGAQVQPCPVTTPGIGSFTDIAANIEGLIIGPNYSPSPKITNFIDGR